MAVAPLSIVGKRLENPHPVKPEKPGKHALRLGAHIERCVVAHQGYAAANSLENKSAAYRCPGRNGGDARRRFEKGRMMRQKNIRSVMPSLFKSLKGWIERDGHPGQRP